MPTISVEQIGPLPRLHVSAERKERPDPPDRAFRFSGRSLLVLRLLPRPRGRKAGLDPLPRRKPQLDLAGRCPAISGPA